MLFWFKSMCCCFAEKEEKEKAANKNQVSFDDTDNQQ